MSDKVALFNRRQRIVGAISTVLSIFTAVPALAAPDAGTKIDFYGMADVNITAMDSGFGNKLTFGSGGFSSSRMGFKLTRDLGAGLQAVGLAEAGLLYDTGLLGNGSVTPGINNSAASSAGQSGNGVQIFSRQVYAGLSGKFGSATIGRQYTASYITTAFVGAAKGEGLLGYSTSVLPLIGGMPTRVNNALVYTTPKAGGVSGTFTYTTGNENNVNTTVPTGSSFTTDEAGRGWDAGLTYSKGPLTAAVTTWRIRNSAFATIGETDLATKKGWQIAGNYDFGAFKVFAGIVDGTISGGNYETVTKTLSSASGATVSALMPLGQHRFTITYTKLNDKSSFDRDAKVYGLGYWYELDPKSKLYAGWGAVKNGRNASYSLADGGNLVGNVTVAGTSVKGFVAGANFAW